MYLARINVARISIARIVKLIEVEKRGSDVAVWDCASNAYLW